MMKNKMVNYILYSISKKINGLIELKLHTLNNREENAQDDKDFNSRLYFLLN